MNEGRLVEERLQDREAVTEDAGNVSQAPLGGCRHISPSNLSYSLLCSNKYGWKLWRGSTYQNFFLFVFLFGGGVFGCVILCELASLVGSNGNGGGAESSFLFR